MSKAKTHDWQALSELTQGHSMGIERVRLQDSGVAIEGAFEPPRLALLRAGVRLTAVIPPQARDQINAEMAKNGVPFDIGQMRPENLEEMIDQINDLQVDVDNERTKVRVFCE